MQNDKHCETKERQPHETDHFDCLLCPDHYLGQSSSSSSRSTASTFSFSLPGMRLMSVSS
jgi:hypothetical protein